MNNLKLDTDILMEVRHLSKCLRKDFDDKLAKHGLTCTQGRVLFYINGCQLEGKELHQSDLERCFQLSKSSVSELLSRMIKNELIEKVRIKSCYTLIPSEKGKSIVDEIHSSRTKVIQKLFAGFTQDEINNVTEYMKRMISNVREEE